MEKFKDTLPVYLQKKKKKKPADPYIVATPQNYEGTSPIQTTKKQKRKERGALIEFQK